MLSWDEVDWSLLASLRERFLSEDRLAGGGDYWTSERELEHYDLAFAPRIGWKWDAVLADARARGWRPPEGAIVFDWGCGTGIATRRLLSAFPDAGLKSAWCWDRSARARVFAAERLRAAGLSAEARADGTPPPAPYVLLVSHVINELADTREPERAMAGAAAVIWVEPGTPEASRRLIALREKWRAELAPVAPCPHAGRCGLADGRRPSDWCHHFAPPPPEVFQSAEWDAFSRRLGIDRRSLPVSYLVLAKEPVAPETRARLLGRPRVYKGDARALACHDEIVEEIRIAKKADPAAFRDLDQPRFARWWRV